MAQRSYNPSHVRRRAWCFSGTDESTNRGGRDRRRAKDPVVNRESSPAAGFFSREKGTTWGPRGAADFISRAASDTVVCTKHLLRLELETTTWSRHQRGEPQRLRGLETHRCPLTGRLKATGSGRRPVPVSTQLGRGAAHSSASQRRVIKSVERARESNQRTGLRDLRAQ